VLSVAVVDEHPVARHGVAAILAGTDLKVVASVDRVWDLPDLATLDLVMLGLNPDGGAASIEAISRLRVRTQVLVMSASGHASNVVAAIRAGANGYLTKHSDATNIRCAAQTAAAGGFVLSPELADILHAEMRRPDPSPTGRPVPAPLASCQRAVLSPREREALIWIARGLTHAQTARRMGVGKSTVDTYIERIRAKLQVGNKAELTRAAIEMLWQPETLR